MCFSRVSDRPEAQGHLRAFSRQASGVRTRRESVACLSCKTFLLSSWPRLLRRGRERGGGILGRVELASASGVVRLLGCNTGSACPRAVSELQRALRLDPDDGLALAASAHLDLRNERWESLLNASTRLLKREVNSAVFKAMEGRALLGLGRDEVALASLREAHRLDANGTAAAHGLVSALNQAGRTEEVGRG